MKRFLRKLFGGKSAFERREIQPINAGAVEITTGFSHYTNKYRQALMYVDALKLDDAILVYQELLTLETNKEMAWIGLGTCFNLKNDPSQALMCYSNALAINENSYTANLGMGSANYKLHDYSTASNYYEKAKASNPDAADSYWGLALAYRYSGNLEWAKMNARIFLQKAPDTRYRDVMEKILLLT